MKLRGTVISGARVNAQEMMHGPLAHFWSIYFGHLEPGTLNVRLNQPHAIEGDLPLPRTDAGLQIIAQRCQVENLLGFIISQVFDGEHEDLREPVLHIVSPFPLRRHLRLEDGREVTLTVTNG